jgi:polysaccharide export outer membrane protein
MGRLILLAIFAVLCMLFAYSAEAQTPAASATVSMVGEYRLGAGDAFRTSVFRRPDLTLDARIGGAGLVSYPLPGSLRIGDIKSQRGGRS